jgi:hypothetical protein
VATEVKPKVLIAATSRWLPTARLAMALHHAGCVVDAVCPPDHVMGKMAAVGHSYTYRGFAPLSSFAHAISASKPDLIVPGDDLATLHLHRLHWGGGGMAMLIERSLGIAESFPVVYARTAFIEIARGQGVRSPKTAEIVNLHDLKQWMTNFGLPTVLKANGTSGGEGVRVVRTREQAERAFRALAAPPLLARALKRAVVDQDQTLLWPSLLRRRPVVNAQEFIAGREATSAVACWQGQVLASLHFEVLQKRDAAGPSSVLRLIDHPEMVAAAERMVRCLKLSGLHGFDFMLEEQTGHACLIEINPRSTQVGHLALGPRRDLAAALYSAITGKAVCPGPKITDSNIIALFPQEWMRDPESAYLQSGYHDVPWEEPELLRAGIRKIRKQGVTEFPVTPTPVLSPAQFRHL